jgi:hypothetical protein
VLTALSASGHLAHDAALFPYFPPCLSAVAGVADFFFFWEQNKPSATQKIKNALKENENISA